MEIMKKIAFLSLMLCGLLGMNAQDATFEFVDAGGNVVPDGKTVTITDVETEEDPETGEQWLLMPAGLSVRNASDVRAALRLHVKIDRMDSGSYQICFPISCLAFDEVGTYQTGETAMMAGEIRSLNTEWLPDADGKCVVQLQVEVLSELGSAPNVRYIHLADGPAITLNFNNGMPEDVNGDGKVDVEDVNAVINIILKSKVAEDFPGQSDVNGDGKVDVEDVNGIINIILKL